jgi:hypothetical protein
MRKRVILLAIVYAFLVTGVSAQKLELTGDIHVFKFSMVKYFPFINAEINGVRGQVMFDTGNENALAVNRHLVNVTGGGKIGSGFVGSGQSYDVYRHDTLEAVGLGDRLKFKNVTGLPAMT